ncbi:twin-arginine translocation signal domain-containing protein [Advenella sp. WQ 585]|uniref:Twin-arginine translocation signal domain-containing protein n=2 Tax=Advenella mandrilli TaxID=2800330 RepID=A0ABS1EHM9_9BURK|nr:twin-arginine translocation signal domain-containing protein [Advenella mandrilli]
METKMKVHRQAGTLTRRSFLKGSAILTGMLASGSILATLAPSRVWALELKQLNQLQADTILAMAKALYPHKDLPDAVYALLVKDIDASAQEAAGAELVKAGVEKLNAAAGGDFAKLSLEKQTDILKAMEKEGNPFFRKVRGQGVTSLYDNDMAYKYFGYEGEVFSRGGYLKNGFDDLKWLPDPPVEASPPFAS